MELPRVTFSEFMESGPCWLAAAEAAAGPTAVWAGGTGIPAAAAEEDINAHH